MIKDRLGAERALAWKKTCMSYETKCPADLAVSKTSLYL